MLPRRQGLYCHWVQVKVLGQNAFDPAKLVFFWANFASSFEIAVVDIRNLHRSEGLFGIRYIGMIYDKLSNFGNGTSELGLTFPFSNKNYCDLSALSNRIRATLGAVVESEAEMASCMHNGQGCSPKGTPVYKCAGYFEHSFACENYVCENHVHRSRYGTFCAQCDPAPPVFDMPRGVRQMPHLAGRAVSVAINHGTAQHR